jgi:tetratricopeptide (TPR) repeat protein
MVSETGGFLLLNTKANQSKFGQNKKLNLIKGARMIKILSIFLLLAGAVIAHGKEATVAQEVDHLALATMMIYDGSFEKARSELDMVDQTAQHFDAPKYYTTKAILETKLGNHSGAIQHYNAAIEATQKSDFSPKIIADKKKYLFSVASSAPVKIESNATQEGEQIKKEKIERLYAHLSQSYYKTNDYLKSVEALDKSGENGKNRPELYAYRADCYWKSKHHEEALLALSKGYEIFNEPSLLKQKYYYLAELKLYRSAIDTAKLYMDKVGKKEDDYLMLGQLLMRANQTDDAIAVLEEARLYFPKNSSFSVMLTHAYLKKNMPHNSASLMENAAVYDKKYAKDSSEMYRRVKDYSHSGYLAMSIANEADNLKQKIAIHLEKNEFDQVIGLKDAMNRNEMLSDDTIRYTLAYAYYMVGDYDNAQEYLQNISDNDLFLKSTVIRKNIEKCKQNSMECM